MDLRAALRRMTGRSPSAECTHVARVLQSYLDGEIDSATADRVAAHLDVCRGCGLEASTYRELKEALARNRPPETETLERLRRFADDLARGEGEPGHQHVER